MRNKKPLSEVIIQNKNRFLCGASKWRFLSASFKILEKILSLFFVSNFAFSTPSKRLFRCSYTKRAHSKQTSVVFWNFSIATHTKENNNIWRVVSVKPRPDWPFLREGDRISVRRWGYAACRHEQHPVNPYAPTSQWRAAAVESLRQTQ